MTYLACLISFHVSRLAGVHCGSGQDRIEDKVIGRMFPFRLPSSLCDNRIIVDEETACAVLQYFSS